MIRLTIKLFFEDEYLWELSKRLCLLPLSRLIDIIDISPISEERIIMIEASIIKNNLLLFHKIIIIYFNL